MTASQDTIYALSSGSLPSGVAVVRVSGRGVGQLIGTMVAGHLAPRVASLCWIRDRNDQRIDQALTLLFPQPASFTGEDCLEIHAHGGRAVVSKILETLSEFGFRHAEPGEFTRRAFEYGKLDLVQAEALADLVSADTEMQRRLAIEQSSGSISTEFASWMKALTRSRALIEAEIDFSEEDDIPDAVSSGVRQAVGDILSGIQRHLDGRNAAEVIRDGFIVAIAGRPNAGKSSLLNCLAKRSVAIVTDIAGTTRDILTVEIDIRGYLVRFVDMAGLRDTDDPIEQEGVLRARQAISAANLVLVLRDCRDQQPFLEVDSRIPVLRIATKSDLDAVAGEMAISSKTGAGIDSLLERISEAVRNEASLGGVTIVRQRQFDYLRQVQSVLLDYLEAPDAPMEIAAEQLRHASHLLGRITGQVDVEDLLDVIFSEFCIGK
jgi:tRNA modification GTPase